MSSIAIERAIRLLKKIKIWCYSIIQDAYFQDFWRAVVFHFLERLSGTVGQRYFLFN